MIGLEGRPSSGTIASDWSSFLPSSILSTSVTSCLTYSCSLLAPSHSLTPINCRLCHLSWFAASCTACSSSSHCFDLLSSWALKWPFPFSRSTIRPSACSALSNLAAIPELTSACEVFHRGNVQLTFYKCCWAASSFWISFCQSR